MRFGGIVALILVYADFDRAELAGVDFSGATLGGARFCRVANLRHAKFTGAIYDSGTRWPPGFDPTTLGAKKVRGDKARAYEWGGWSGGPGLYDTNFPRC